MLAEDVTGDCNGMLSFCPQQPLLNVLIDDPREWGDTQRTFKVVWVGMNHLLPYL